LAFEKPLAHVRLWSVHPKYLDPQGLVALWREALLARAVLRGGTRGYRNHPQLRRFQSHPAPISVINSYLSGIHAEAEARGYSFDRSKIGTVTVQPKIAVTADQLAYEWQHLLYKLATRNPLLYDRWRKTSRPECHPLFEVLPGPVADWERQQPRQG
jgi:hypothetical protein